MIIDWLKGKNAYQGYRTFLLSSAWLCLETDDSDTYTEITTSDSDTWVEIDSTDSDTWAEIEPPIT